MFGLMRAMKYLPQGGPMDSPQGTAPMTPMVPNQTPAQMPSSGVGALDFLSGKTKIPTSGLGMVDAVGGNGIVPVGRPLAQWSSGPGWTGSGQGNNPTSSTTVARPGAQAAEGAALLDLLRSPDVRVRRQALQQFAQNVRDRGRKPGPLAFGLIGLAARRGK